MSKAYCLLRSQPEANVGIGGCATRNQRFSCESKTLKTSASERDVGVFLVRSEPEDRGHVAARHDRQLGLVRHKRHFSRLGLVVLAVQALIERSDPLAVDLRHVRMQEGRSLLHVCQQLGQFCLGLQDHQSYP